MIEFPPFLAELTQPLKGYSYLSFMRATEILPEAEYDVDGRVLEVILVGCPSFDIREGIWDLKRIHDDSDYPAFAIRWKNYGSYQITVRECMRHESFARGVDHSTDAGLKGDFEYYEIRCLHHDINIFAPSKPVIARLR